MAEKRSPQLTDAQVDEVLAWLDLLAEDGLRQKDIARMIGVHEVTVHKAIGRVRRPGGAFWRGYKKWIETSSNAARTEDRETAVDVLSKVEVVLRRARTLLDNQTKFRPLLRPGIGQLTALLDEALSLLEFE